MAKRPQNHPPKVTPKSTAEKVITESRKARFNYELTDFYEGGLVLTGTEVKSLRLGNAHVNEAYASHSRGEIWLIGSHIAAYKNAGYEPHEERRSRKVLLHKAQIEKIRRALEQKGLTLVPVKLYWQKGLVKVTLALGKGKNTVDKRDTIKKRESDRELRRVFKGRHG